MNFLKNLDYLLAKSHMSRSDLGRAIGVSPSTINSWFYRSSDSVALKSLVDIARYFNVSLDDLVNGEVDKPKDTQFTDAEVSQIKRLLKVYEVLEGK